jgi:biotin carboxyl carrier protein
LFPKEACDDAKGALKAAGIAWSGKKEVTPHPMYEGRRTPLRQLVKRLGVGEYEHPSEFGRINRRPSRVVIPLAQHVGSPAVPSVKVGQHVRKDDRIGDIPEGKLGAAVHASIDGVVREISQNIVIESA